jgi:hypothetical protein
MDISALTSLSTKQPVMTNVNVAVLGMSLDAIETMGDNFTKMLEQSVQPNLGQNIDILL